MQVPGDGRTRTARIWTYVRDERPWLGQAPPAAWYQFTVDRKGAHPANHLADYHGWMHADGYAGFNELYRSGGISEVACLAHIRRKFTDVLQAEGSTIAEEAIRRIAGLYGVEKQARGLAPEERVEIRQAKAEPIFEDLEAWLNAQLPKLSGKSELAKAIRYALTRMKKLRPYLAHGFLEADNNSAERSMKPVALGRKNYLFVGSEGGGKSAAIAYPDRDRQAQRRRSASLAHRHPRPHRRSQDYPDRRDAPLAFRSGLTVTGQTPIAPEGPHRTVTVRMHFGRAVSTAPMAVVAPPPDRRSWVPSRKRNHHPLEAAYRRQSHAVERGGQLAV